MKFEKQKILSSKGAESVFIMNLGVDRRLPILRIMAGNICSSLPQNRDWEKRIERSG